MPTFSKKDIFEYASRLVSAKQYPADYPVEEIVKEFLKAAELLQRDTGGGPDSRQEGGGGVTTARLRGI
jgi:hypothetical protein